MKKDDIALAVKTLRIRLNSDAIVDGSFDCISKKEYQACLYFKSSIVSLVVSGKGHFDRLSPLELKVARQLEIAALYEDKAFHSLWVPLWSSLPHFVSGQQDVLVGRLKNFEERIFIEAHRRIVTADELFSANLHTDHKAEEFIAEVVMDELDPTIEDVENTLRLIRELAKVFCDAFHPGEFESLRVTYLDMGSNYQIGIKADGKAEIGANLTKFLTQILRFITNPRAFIESSRIETLRQKVDAFADLQTRVSAGQISHETAELLAAELFGAAKNLTAHNVFPASLLKEKEETNTVDQFRSLARESAAHMSLPNPKLELPESTSSGEIGQTVAA